MALVIYDCLSVILDNEMESSIEFQTIKSVPFRYLKKKLIESTIENP